MTIQMTISRRWYYFFAILVLTLALALILILTRPETDADLQPPLPQRVVSGEVKRLDVQPVSRITGELQPRRTSHLHFEVAGQVTRRLVEPGQTVAAGEVLFAVAAGDYEDAVTQAAAALETERAAILRDRELLDLMQDEQELQRREVERFERLGRDSLASKSSYDSAMRQLLRLQAETRQLQYSVDTAAARLREREAAVRRAQRDLTRTELQAPYAATVDQVLVDAGDYVAAGQVAVHLVDLSELDLVLNVSGEVATALAPDQPINVHADGQVLTGRIVALAAVPDPQTHTYRLRVRLAAAGLYPGQLATAELPGQFVPDAQVVPAGAVLHEAGQAFIFEIVENQLQRREIELLRRLKDAWMIKGIEPGARIVIQDVAVLADGQTVSVGIDTD
ncbi:MAG: efflux RND transporter periplasmic adaptor subunit [Gammaproteobacteria bacterium]